MKINLPWHTIETRTKNYFTYTDEVGRKNITAGSENWRKLILKEIPLAYINTDNVEYEPDIKIEDQFKKGSSYLVRPYDTFKDSDPFLFDSNKQLKSGNMKLVSGLYYYEPEQSTEFSPMTFNTYLEVKKDYYYFNDTMYNIEVKVVDSTQNLSFANELISIFGDKYIYGDCPPNIRINGGSTAATSLTNHDLASADFIFLQSHDGIHLGDSNLDEDTINFEHIMNNHTNIWMSVSNDYYGRFINNVSPILSTDITYKDQILFEDTVYRINTDTLLLFDQDMGFSEDQWGNYPDIVYPCEAMLVIHRKDKGYIVVTPSWFLEEYIEETKRMVYETMIQIYLKSYIKSKSATVWITDQPIDYISYHEKRYGLRHALVSIEELLENYDRRMIITKVVVDTSDVEYIGVSNRNELLFRKKETATPDPLKPSSQLSFYTTKHSIIYYQPENLSVLNESIDIEVVKQNSSALVIVHPYLSSDNKIHTTKDQNFEILNMERKYTLYVTDGSREIENSFILSEDEDLEYTKVATIRFNKKNDTSICDTRILGGGLPDAQPDDYDMLDIGHVLGRPYRMGAALIISLPLRLEPYKDRIAAELNKHISAGDDYSLVFYSRKED